jgi:hypothetical protein
MPQFPPCGRWTACLGGGRLQRIGAHFWNGNTTQLSSIDLGRTLRKPFAAFRTFRPQMETEIDAHALLYCIFHRKMWCTVEVDVHWKASTEQMRGDTELRFCTCTCRELTRFPLCCHLTMCYSFPGKKSVPELNDQPTYVAEHDSRL